MIEVFKMTHNIVRLSGGSRAVAAATVAAAGCCREEEYDVVGDEGASCCTGVAAIRYRYS